MFCCFIEETGKSLIHDLQSEVSGDYGKALLILAEVLVPSSIRNPLNQNLQSARTVSFKCLECDVILNLL